VGDIFMGLGVLVCGLGYAEGARLSRHLGGWQTISWALVYALPVMLPLVYWQAPASWSSIGWRASAGLVYVSLFSMLIGFIFWYRGLALGGIAAVGQLQLLQPFFGLVLAAGLLREAVSWDLLAVSLGVVVCVAAAKQAATGIPSRPTKQRATLASTR
jgi:drug/metabolite transporter (DMT)-like permease